MFTDNNQVYLIPISTYIDEGYTIVRSSILVLSNLKDFRGFKVFKIGKRSLFGLYTHYNALCIDLLFLKVEIQ